MIAFYAELRLNLKRRIMDGFAVGYHIVFPFIIIFLLGALCKGIYKGEVTSFQYYTIVMIPFTIMMGIVTAAYAGKDDAYAKVAQRVLIAPITRRAIVMSKVISCTIVFSICSLFVYGIMAILFDIHTGKSLLGIMALCVSTSFFISAFGTVIGMGMKNFYTVKNVITLPICMFAILGGTFFPIGSFQAEMQMLLNLSPLTWINRSLFLALYDKNQRLLWSIIIILILAGMICTFIAVTLFKKEEYIYGDLPSYEK